MRHFTVLAACLLLLCGSAEASRSSREQTARNFIEAVRSESTPVVLIVLCREKDPSELLTGLVEKSKNGDELAFSTLSEIFLLATEYELRGWAIPTTRALLQVALALPQQMSPAGRSRLPQMAKKVADHLHYIRRAYAAEPRQQSLANLISIFVYEYSLNATSRSVGASVLAPEFAHALLWTTTYHLQHVNEVRADLLEEVPELAPLLIETLELFLEVQMDRKPAFVEASKESEAIRLLVYLLAHRGGDFSDLRPFLLRLTQAASLADADLIYSLLIPHFGTKGTCFDLFD